LIICEGAAHKSEPAYFEALKKDYTFAGNKIDIEIVNTKYNTGKELVKVAKQKLSDGFKDVDEAWIVYDKDGYTKHAETFDTARANKIHIAFSFISFEEWILLHFTYTTRPLPDSDAVIKYIKDNCSFVYEKADTETYEKIPARIGYSTPAYFYKLFRTRYHMTPVEFRSK
jgi:AraC-like DNA-binding protein